MIDPDVNELDALKTLLESDGWAVFLRYVDQQHGDAASVRAIDTALSGVNRGDRDAVDETVTQIRSAAKAVQRIVAWPKERIGKLQAKDQRGGLLSRRRA